MANLQSILRWSIENTEPQGEQSNGDRPPPKQFDPEIIDAILGKPDSELMKEALAVAANEEKDEEARLTALDDFEMLIEIIDNANNVEKMNMWPKIQEILVSSRSSDAIRSAVLWIIGTAVQNNPAAQNAYLSLPDSPISSILSYLSPSESSSSTRSKAVYALSGLLKHNAKAVDSLEEIGGWDVLKAALEDPDITVRRKVAFLLNSLLLSTGSSASVRPPAHPNSHVGLTTESVATSDTTAKALQAHGITKSLVQSLTNPLPHGIDGDVEGDVDFEEKLVRLFSTYLTVSGGKLEENERNELRGWIQERRKQGERWELGQEELDALLVALA